MKNPLNPASKFDISLGVLAGVALCVGMLGCSSEEPEVKKAVRPVVAPVTAAPAPKAPKLTPVADLMAQYSIDERIILPEDRAPDNDNDRVAVLEFFDGFARGDKEALGSMMSDLDRRELELVSSQAAWKDTIAKITEVTLETGTGPFGEKCALAIYEVDGDYQPQLWYYKSDEDGYTFDAAATPPGIMDKLYGDDFIARWHDLLQEEIMLANQLDTEIETNSIILSESSGGGSVSGGRPSRPKNPGFSPGRPGKPDRRPPGKKRKPPGAR